MSAVFSWSFLGACLGSLSGWTLWKPPTCPLTLKSSIKGSRTVFQFRQNFSDCFSSLWCFCCWIPSIFFYPATEPHKWRVCCQSACKPASWYCCGEWRFQWQAEIYHSWEACSKSVAWVLFNYLFQSPLVNLFSFSLYFTLFFHSISCYNINFSIFVLRNFLRRKWGLVKLNDLPYYSNDAQAGLWVGFFWYKWGGKIKMGVWCDCWRGWCWLNCKLVMWWAVSLLWYETAGSSSTIFKGF